jgi:hypothetical protein
VGLSVAAFNEQANPINFCLVVSPPHLSLQFPLEVAVKTGLLLAVPAIEFLITCKSALELLEYVISLISLGIWPCGHEEGLLRDVRVALWQILYKIVLPHIAADARVALIRPDRYQQGRVAFLLHLIIRLYLGSAVYVLNIFCIHIFLALCCFLLSTTQHHFTACPLGPNLTVDTLSLTRFG